METPTPTPQTPPLVGHTVKETITSIVIAFIMAFVFRGFVVEAFLIPTGSMAPTLLGSHMRFESPQSGYSWAVGPWWVKSDGMTPDQVQGNPNQPVIVHDPMTGYELQNDTVPIRWGDRIFVMKYLYSLFDPQRFDVVVFRNPPEPTVNFIKRLIGLPGEVIEGRDGAVLVDGEALAEPYLDGAVTSTFAPVELGPDQLFVLGDNREASADSRSFGPVNASEVVGRAELVLWPPVDIGRL